jgi:hypothetical protein
MARVLQAAIMAGTAAATVWLSTEAAHTATTGLPRYDTVRYCDVVGDVGLTQSGTVLAGCHALERDALARLTTGWAIVPDKVAALCQGAATFAGPGSYAVLAGCIDQQAEKQ